MVDSTASANQSQINDSVVYFYHNTVLDHTYNGTLYQELGDQGYTGALQDRQMAWLGDGGYTGTLQDRMYAWLTAQGEPAGHINDMILGYYQRTPGEGQLVTYEGDGVYYGASTNWVTSQPYT
jgi:hypothetical protein